MSLSRVLAFLLPCLALSAPAADVRYFLQLADPGFGEPEFFLNNAVGAPVILDRLIVDEVNGSVIAAITLDSVDVGQLQGAVQGYFGPGPVFKLYPAFEITPDGAGTGGQTNPPANNDALDSYVLPPQVPHFPAPPSVAGKVRVNIVGTGIDQGHPDLLNVTFVSGLSRMLNPDFLSPDPFLDPSIDYHNHETALAACIAGQQTGLLPRLGQFTGLEFRSVLTYSLPQSGVAPRAFSSDSVIALNDLIADQKTRMETPYLKNHAAVICFAHSISEPGSRDGVLELMFDLAWQNNILTVLSAGNRSIDAAISSPAGIGELIVHNDGSGQQVTTRYWPPYGSFNAKLPTARGFLGSSPEGAHHLKIGAFSSQNFSQPWTVSSTLGSNINVANTTALGDPTTNGVDLFTAGQNIIAACSQLSEEPRASDLLLNGQHYSRTRNYQQVSGTSYSAAYATALATAIFAHNPWASPAQVRDAVMTASSASSTPGTSQPNFSTLQLPSQIPHIPLTFAQWHARYVALDEFFFETSGITAADEDQDGITNLMEYVCGMDPRIQDAHLAPVVVRAPGGLKLVFQRAAYLPAEVDWTFEQSTDLDTWTPAGKGQVTHGTTRSDGGDGADLDAVLPTVADHFYRFSATVSQP